VVDQEGAALSAAGHEVSTFERSNDSIDTMSRLEKLMIPGRVVWSNSARSTLREELRRLKPDVAHLHNTFPLLSPSVLYACRDERVPVVMTYHNYRQICPAGTLFREGSVCSECIGRWAPLPALRHGCYGSVLKTVPLAVGVFAHHSMWKDLLSASIFISHAQCKHFATLGLSSDRVFVKENLIPPMRIEAAAKEDKVAFVGRLTDTKGVPTLMRAWERYLQQSPRPRLRLVIVGAGPLDGVVREWASANPTVEFVGILDRAACALQVAGSRAAIVPSDYEEPFGLVIVEAMAAGVPPVASAHGAFPELITDGRNGVLFEPRNADALAKVILDVDSDQPRFEEMGKRARETYEERFDPGANLDQLVSIYQFAIMNPVWGA